VAFALCFSIHDATVGCFVLSYTVWVGIGWCVCVMVWLVSVFRVYHVFCMIWRIHFCMNQFILIFWYISSSWVWSAYVRVALMMAFHSCMRSFPGIALFRNSFPWFAPILVVPCVVCVLQHDFGFVACVLHFLVLCPCYFLEFDCRGVAAVLRYFSLLRVRRSTFAHCIAILRVWVMSE